MKCDLHVHTHYSYDSNSSPKQVVEEACKKGIDCLAITDHDDVRGAQEAVKYVQENKKPILIIPGIEIKSRQGDILGLNIKEVIASGLSAKETIKKIKEKGGMAVIAHPFATFCSFSGDLKEFLGEIDGIEVLNASLSMAENKKALDLARKHNIAFTAGSDAHFYEFVGRGYIELPVNSFHTEDILRAIKEKKGKLGGNMYFFKERLKDHFKRGIVKFINYVGGKETKI